MEEILLAKKCIKCYRNERNNFLNEGRVKEAKFLTHLISCIQTAINDLLN